MFSVRKICFLTCFLSIFVVTSGCNSSSDEPDDEVVIVPDDSADNLALLQSAKDKWDAQSGQFYTIQSQRFCECQAEVSSEKTISVSNNLILAATDVVSEEEVSKEVQENLLTIDELFASIEKAIADGVSIEVIYNPEYGYPESVKLDLEQLAVDGGLHVELSNLEIKNSLLALDQVTWSLESFDSIAGPQPIIADTVITLSVDMQNSQFIGTGGCNSYSADFVVDEKNNITVSNLTSTEIACNSPENIMQQEQSYFSTLQQVQFFNFDKTRLNMVVGGDAGLHFVAEQNLDISIVGENLSNDLAMLQSAKSTWDSQSGQYYTIQSKRFCNCDEQASAQMEISVLDSTVLSATDISSGEPVSKEAQENLSSVDALFALIEKALADGISIEVAYNQEYGYPESVKINLEQLAVDGGLHVELSNFEIQDALLALDDVTWSLESFGTIAGPRSIIENSLVTMSIDFESMQLSGVGGCNSYTADFLLDNKNYNITITNLVSTEESCDNPEDIMQQEMSYFATLQQTRFFTFDDSRLNLTVGGDSSLFFVPADLSISAID